jgi:hypothetical protein
MLRASAVLLAAAAACQPSKSKLDDHAKPPADAAGGGIKVENPHGPPKPEIVVPPTDWATCDAALAAAPKAPAMRRVQQIVNACRVCGDWKPLLDWSKEPKDGGPTRAEIEQAMLACKAYCNPNAKQRFLVTLDQFRGKSNRGPWRFLGELCKTETSAVPDNRYASAPYFALDRIARAAAARPESAKLLEAIELPMPVISPSGFGSAPDVGPITLTVAPNDIRVSTIARARLGKDGVVVTYAGEPYPGAAVKTEKDLAAELAKLPEPLRKAAIGIFAPHAMAAARLLDALALAGDRTDVRLAVAAEGGLPGWAMAGSIPIALRTRPHTEKVQIDLADNPDAAIEELKKQKATLVAILKKLKPGQVLTTPVLVIALAPAAKVDGLAKLLGAAGYFDVKSVALIGKK